MKNRNYGILTSISWNSNGWTGPATTEDVIKSNYEWVKENHRMVEDLNFAHSIYPTESDGTYIAYTPMFDRKPSFEESRYVEIVLFRSLNYHLNQNLIVGFYAFPEIGTFLRKADHEIYRRYSEGGNVKSKVEHIVLFKAAIPISETIVKSQKFLPEGKKLGQQGFNYLHYDNVMKILDAGTSLNPENQRIKSIKMKFLTEFKPIQ